MKTWMRIALVTLIVLACTGLSIELVSRAADGKVGTQRYDPDSLAALKKQGKRVGLLQKLSFAYLDPAAVRVEGFRTMPHPYLGYALKPGWSTHGAEQQCSHNTLGFRGKETTWEKPAGTFRILTLGGSSVYGQSESNDAAVWSARLEVLLNDRRPAHPIEVINGGVSGWTSFEMLGQLAFRGVDLAPDLVVIYETINDVRAALYTAGDVEPHHDNTHWRATWPVDRPSWIEQMLEHCRCYLVWRRFFTPYLERRADLGYYAMVRYDAQSNELYCARGKGGYPGGKVPERGFLNYQRNLESLIAVAEAHGAKVFIATQAVMDWDIATKECPDIQTQSVHRIQDIQREVARARGVALGETGAAIEAEEKRVFESSGKHLFKNDVHPTDEGSDLIARTIAAELVKQRLVP